MSEYPQGDAGEVARAWETACREIAGDPAVWSEEARDAAPLPWPVDGAPYKGYDGLLRILYLETVDQLLACMAEYGWPAPPKDRADAGFQQVLRVAKRVIVKLDKALVDRFGGSGRLAVKRALQNWLRERDVRAADRLPTRAERAAALNAAGIKRSAASDARKRTGRA